ncbi:MAG TPA: hypothetical protein VL053_15025 [Arachidicoccus sp.]|nr:hypothetical protein [Arachidicoccus sp.]
MNIKIIISLIIGFSLLGFCVHAQHVVKLSSGKLSVEWQQGPSGYAIKSIRVLNSGGKKELKSPSGLYTFLFSKHRPDTTSMIDQLGARVAQFPGASYKYIINTWRQDLRPVPMNTAGVATQFFPSTAVKNRDNSITFTASTSRAIVMSTWSLDAAFPTDMLVEITLKAKEDGYYSFATPTLADISPENLQWGVIPGVFQGAYIESDLVRSYAYGHGIPDKPVIVRDRTTSTLSPIITTEAGISIAAIPAPGLARDPWSSTTNTHSDWKVGFSLMNRQSVLFPTCYYPVLGELDSYLHKNETKVFKFRYCIQSGDWFKLFEHVVNDIYRFDDFLKLKRAKQSLTSRMLAIDTYLHSDKTSQWRIEDFNNIKIGAQAYLGGVVGSDKDAMKNSDYGAMWMLAAIMSDSILLKTRLPYARNFKLAQQQITDGFFKGAAAGQYYLSKAKHFTEEWGNYVEPVALTYYIMADIGNILLFDSTDTTLRDRLRLGADKLLQWQHADGHWEVGYDRTTTKPVFTDLKDYRPTFYGLVIAYHVLGDKKYKEAAIKGANWFIKEAVNKGRFLGVCGDTRFVPDFATVQSAEALLSLYLMTKDKKYLNAAIQTSRFYTTSIYTHPMASTQKKLVNGVEKQDWEISQVGLSFEHGGAIGSANKRGPILLASHAGSFVRMFQYTGDSLFINMARAAALGRDAFVDSATSVASYYWDDMNKGAGPFPHHGWWQIGWLTDYLLSEIDLRSNGKIHFPAGFITPKVGPHKSYGFAPGKVFDEEANLVLPGDILHIGNALFDYFGARSVKGNTLYFLVLNNNDEDARQSVHVDIAAVQRYTGRTVEQMVMLDEKGHICGWVDEDGQMEAGFPKYGLRVVKIQLSDSK